MRIFGGPKQILFSHTFAKAFWGEKNIETGRIYSTYHGESQSGTTGTFHNGDRVYSPVYAISWEHHLQKMVLEENPIKYLERFL